MKKIFLIALVASFAVTAFAQTEVKINPLGLLFGSPDISAEFGVSDNIGVEAGIGLEFGKTGTLSQGVNDDYQLRKSGLGFFAAGKYYFSPEEGFDRFGVGIYAQGKNFKTTAIAEDASTFKRSTLGVGLMLQYKWVASSGILFEINAGAGRNFVEKTTWDNDLFRDLLPKIGINAFFRLNVGYRFGGGN